MPPALARIGTQAHRYNSQTESQWNFLFGKINVYVETKQQKRLKHFSQTKAVIFMDVHYFVLTKK